MNNSDSKDIMKKQQLSCATATATPAGDDSLCHQLYAYCSILKDHGKFTSVQQSNNH
jgi:hypothetical protein